MATLTHPEEVARLMAADDARTKAEEREDEGLRCPRCRRPDSVYYLRDDCHWYTPCYQCNCGWWQPVDEFEGDGAA